MQIVPMSRDNVDEVAALEQRCFPDPWSRNLFLSELENELSAWLVALDGDGHAAGYAGFHVLLDTGTVLNLAVRPDCRRQGIAKELLQTFLRFSRANQLSNVTLEVRASNHDAIALYGALGFRGVGRRRNYYEQPREDALIMTLDLGG